MCFPPLGQQLALLADQDDAVQYTQQMSWWIASELHWHRMGRPYYKLWPGICDQLCRTAMNFDSKYLQLPFLAYTVLLPIGYFSTDAMLVTMTNRLDDEREYRRLTVSFGNSGFGDHFLVLNLFEGETIEKALTLLDRKNEDIRTRCENDISKQESDQLYPLAIATAMFGIDQHELVAPDTDREVLMRKYPKGRSKAAERVARELREKYLSKITSFRVGSEIDLPRPDVIRVGSPEDKGSELTQGHMRSGHMKMQPCGPKNQDRKLIFVAPTVVRPDLPMATKGYRIRT